ncbi:hypothetical protein Tcan_16340 [Toxocara canis]|uniref:Uncharacterized protein n=1 Tax=Toxocara canis TaxID=6265 RepID=A0A0B2VQY7_TOXCA|nr:hypothetical protein Tcan_16340 [Toxocara canis]
MIKCRELQMPKVDIFSSVLEPITMQTKLSMNQKPETDGTDWKTPKIDLKLGMETLALCIGKLQYQDLLLFLEAQERFNTATRYLKYRPPLNEYHGHYREWYEPSFDSAFIFCPLFAPYIVSSFKFVPNHSSALLWQHRATGSGGSEYNNTTTTNRNVLHDYLKNSRVLAWKAFQ